MLKTQHPRDYLKKEEVNLEATEQLEEQHTEQDQRSLQPKSRLRRQYNPDDISIAKLFTAIREHRTGSPPKDKVSKIKTLIYQVQNINDSDFNDNGNTPLHVAVSKGHKDIVKLLLGKQGININVKNDVGRTPLDIANSLGKKDITQVLEKHIQPNSQASVQQLEDHRANNEPKQGSSGQMSKLNQEQQSTINDNGISKELFRKINVPGDGSCLFWAAALAYLIPVKYDDNVFKERFEKLFGSVDSVELDRIQELIKSYNLSSNSVTLRDKILRRLVTEKFRNRVVDEISSHQSKVEESITIHDFLYSKNEDYVIGGKFQEKFRNRFSAEVNQYSIDINKLKPATLNEATVQEIDNELDKIPDQNKVKKFKFETYLECMRDPRAWGGNHEIQANESSVT